MKKLTNCDKKLTLSDLITRITNSLTDIQWTVLERRLIFNDTLETIGRDLGVASTRVSHIQNKAFQEIIKLFHDEIECFSIKLEKLLADANGPITIEECLIEFPEISEAEFIILFEVFRKNRSAAFQQEEGLITLGE